jgi:ornithine carbamoyltransferase
LFGFELRLACPEGYEPDRAIFEANATRAKLLITEDPAEAVAGAHVVNTDVWASMGQESEAAARQGAFAGYCVDDQLLDGAASDAIVLHCLPAHRGEEISEAVLEGPRSRVWDEAENRLHAQKALMVLLMQPGRKVT